jgi:hypothetical protein
MWKMCLLQSLTGNPSLSYHYVYNVQNQLLSWSPVKCKIGGEAPTKDWGWQYGDLLSLPQGQQHKYEREAAY